MQVQATGLVVVVVAADVMGTEQTVGRQHDEETAGTQRGPDGVQQTPDVVRVQVLDQLVGDGQIERAGVHRRMTAVGDDELQIGRQVRQPCETLADIDGRHLLDPVAQGDGQPPVSGTDLEHARGCVEVGGQGLELACDLVGAAGRLGLLGFGRTGLGAVQHLLPGAGVKAGALGGLRDQDPAAHARVGQVVRGDPFGSLVAQTAWVGAVEAPCP